MDESAISPIIDVILLLSMTLLIAVIIFTVLSPQADIIGTTPYVAADVEQKYLTEDQYEVIEFIPKAGPLFEIVPFGDDTGTSSSATEEVAFRLNDPSDTSYDVLLPENTSYQASYGHPYYIYRTYQGGYMLTDSLASINKDRVGSFVPGDWSLMLFDPIEDVLLQSYTTAMTGIETASPKTWWNLGDGWNVTNSTGATLDRTDVGNITHDPTGGPNGTSSTYFDGSSYVQIADNPDLDFDDAMSISLWMKPDRLGGSSPYFNLVGKGKSDVDNYDLFQINGQLWFEWTEPGGQHYHVQSTDASLSTVDWNFITVVAEDDTVKLYQGDTALNLQWYNSPTIGSSPIAGPVPVHLQTNDDPLHIGRQDHGVWDFEYEGEMGEIAFYDYGLTGTDIAENYASFAT